MPQVERKIIKERTRSLILEGKNELNKLLHSMIGKKLNALCETKGLARCENFAIGVIENGSDELNGKIVEVIASGVRDEKLILKLI